MADQARIIFGFEMPAMIAEPKRLSRTTASWASLIPTPARLFARPLPWGILRVDQGLRQWVASLPTSFHLTPSPTVIDDQRIPNGETAIGEGLIVAVRSHHTRCRCPVIVDVGF